MAGNLRDVVLNHFSQLSLVSNAFNPAWELRVPDKSVASEQLSVLRSEIGGLVGSVEGELTTGSLKGIPFHAVLRSNLAKGRVDDVRSLGRAQSAGVGAGAVVLLALGDEQSIQALSVARLASVATSRAGRV